MPIRPERSQPHRHPVGRLPVRRVGVERSPRLLGRHAPPPRLGRVGGTGFQHEELRLRFDGNQLHGAVTVETSIQVNLTKTLTRY